MPRYRMTLSGPVQLTEQEEAAMDAEAFEATKTAKLAELQKAYETANYADIDHASKTWKADQTAQQLLAAVLSVGSAPPGMYWRDITEANNTVTYSDLQALAAAIRDRGLLLDTNLYTKKAAVEAATTIAEVNSITW